MTEKQEIFNLMGGRVKMWRETYNPTSDAVWLASFAPSNTTKVLDVGIGTGGITMCLLANNKDAVVTGLDVSEQMLETCAKNAALNNRKIELLNQDIMTWRTNRTFDLVITNPPYFCGTPASHNAHHNTDIEQWVKKCLNRTRPRGTFCIIIDAKCVSTVISCMSQKCGDIFILPLFGSKSIAERVLIRGRIGTRGGTIIHRGLPMNFEPVLRDGLTIDNVLSTVG